MVAAGCGGAESPSPQLVKGPGVTLSIPAGWVDAAPSASAMPAGNGKSAYVVGVQSNSALDGFNPNLVVFVDGPQQIDWAAGDGLSEPTVDEIANYARDQVRTEANPLLVTTVAASRIASEPAAEFAFTRTVAKCSCPVRQTSVTAKHGGLVYSAIFTSADKSTKAMAPILASLRASWRWIGGPVATPSSNVPASYAPGDVLLTLADLPESFQPVDNYPSNVPDGATKLFRASSPSRQVLAQAVVKSDEATAEVYRGLRATHRLDVETSELAIPANAQTLLPQSRMFEGVISERSGDFKWLRIVWRNGVTVGEIASEGVSDIVGLALKQAAHTRVAAAPTFSVDQQSGASASSGNGVGQPVVGQFGQVAHLSGADVRITVTERGPGHLVIDVSLTNTAKKTLDYNQLNWTLVGRSGFLVYTSEPLHPMQLLPGASAHMKLTFNFDASAAELRISGRAGSASLEIPLS